VSVSDYVMDIGPGAGDEGGRVVACGTPAEVAKVKGSRTAGYLARYVATRWSPGQAGERAKPAPR